MYNRWMEHSAKGTTWRKKNAKYIKKLPDGTYLYETPATINMTKRNEKNRKQLLDSRTTIVTKPLPGEHTDYMDETIYKKTGFLGLKQVPERKNRYVHDEINITQIDTKGLISITMEEFSKKVKGAINKGRTFLKNLFNGKLEGF